MRPTLFRIVLQVADIEQATGFYAAVLGAPGRRVSGGRHYFDCGGTILACLDPRADGDQFEAVPAPDHIYLAIDDLEHTREAVQTAGGRLAPGSMGSIARRPWGERSFYAEDPFGNKLCFVDRNTVFTGK